MGHFIDPIIFKQEIEKLRVYLKSRDMTPGEFIHLLRDYAEISFAAFMSHKKMIEVEKKLAEEVKRHG